MATLHLPDLRRPMQRGSSQTVQDVDFAAVLQEDIHDVPVGFVGGDVERSEKGLVLVVQGRPFSDERLGDLFSVKYRRQTRAMSGSAMGTASTNESLVRQITLGTCHPALYSFKLISYRLG